MEVGKLLVITTCDRELIPELPSVTSDEFIKKIVATQFEIVNFYNDIEKKISK